MAHAARSWASCAQCACNQLTHVQGQRQTHKIVEADVCSFTKHSLLPPRYASGTEATPARDQAPPVRPEFPPPSLGLQPFFPPELEGGAGGDLLFVWSFLHSFGDLLG